MAQSELSRMVPAFCGEVWNYAKSAGLSRPGRHVAVYLDGLITLECGVIVGAPFEGDGRVVCSSTPSGLAATAIHLGDYRRLGEAHAAILEWCRNHGYATAGPSWEVYGHWVDGQEPRTEVYYLVTPA